MGDRNVSPGPWHIEYDLCGEIAVEMRTLVTPESIKIAFEFIVLYDVFEDVRKYFNGDIEKFDLSLCAASRWN